MVGFVFPVLDPKIEHALNIVSAALSVTTAVYTWVLAFRIGGRGAKWLALMFSYAAINRMLIVCGLPINVSAYTQIVFWVGITYSMIRLKVQLERVIRHK